MTINPRIAAAISVFAISVSGCGSSDGGGGGPTGGLTQTQIINTGNALISQYGAAPPTASMPTAGTATYQGVGATSPFSSTPSGILATATSVFETTTQVNFASSTFSGQAYNFHSTSPGVSLSGNLTANGTIVGSAFSGSVTGTVVEQGITYNYGGSLSGNFVGSNADAIVGVGTATASTPSGPLTVNAYWGAARQ